MSQGELVALMRLASEQRAREQADEQALGRLTARERDVLQALGAGLSDKEIAERLSVSKDTVHTHMVNLLGKLGVESRLQALIVAVRHGLITLT
jgi:DNA-binding NarL/FixJ family response regulator